MPISVAGSAGLVRTLIRTLQGAVAVDDVVGAATLIMSLPAPPSRMLPSPQTSGR